MAHIAAVVEVDTAAVVEVDTASVAEVGHEIYETVVPRLAKHSIATNKPRLKGYVKS